MRDIRDQIGALSPERRELFERLVKADGDGRPNVAAPYS